MILVAGAFPGRLNGRLQLLVQLGYLRVLLLGGLLQLVDLRLGGLLVGGDLLDEGLDLRLLPLQLGLGRLPLSTGGLGLRLGLLQLRLGLLKGVPGGLELVADPLVIVGNGVDGVQPVQQIGKAVGGKEDRPVGHRALLLHGPALLLEEGELGRLPGLVVRHLLLLLHDKGGVLLQLGG